jgi:hypothetical protein
MISCYCSFSFYIINIYSQTNTMDRQIFFRWMIFPDSINSSDHEGNLHEKIVLCLNIEYLCSRKEKSVAVRVKR